MNSGCVRRARRRSSMYADNKSRSCGVMYDVRSFPPCRPLPRRIEIVRSARCTSANSSRSTSPRRRPAINMSPTTASFRDLSRSLRHCRFRRVRRSFTASLRVRHRGSGAAARGGWMRVVGLKHPSSASSRRSVVFSPCQYVAVDVCETPRARSDMTQSPTIAICREASPERKVRSRFGSSARKRLNRRKEVFIHATVLGDSPSTVAERETTPATRSPKWVKEGNWSGKGVRLNRGCLSVESEGIH
jgi:hypothetical protein